ncbi:hypothetical protein CJU90_4250 [Yarrowia sp. C11]|nr:hypothetical protein CKK34_6534 [Yarrowia sp. E02]KAG5365191.1 hypothetical protein CJU90_4250 [Yarrowia sp. C11]
MAKSKKCCYGVRKGRETGVFTTWARVQPLVDKFPGAQFKGFESRAQAELWVGLGANSSPTKSPSKSYATSSPKSTPPSSQGYSLNSSPGPSQNFSQNSPRLERSPRKVQLGTVDLRSIEEPPSPTRSPRRPATRPTNGETKEWRPTASETELAMAMFNVIQSEGPEKWIRVDVTAKVEEGSIVYGVHFDDDRFDNVRRAVNVDGCTTPEEELSRAVLVGILKVCRLISEKSEEIGKKDKYEIHTSQTDIGLYYRQLLEDELVIEDGIPEMFREVMEPTVELLKELQGRVGFGEKE